MSFCLPKFAADKMREGFVSGRFSPEKLARMTSAERRATFTELIGEGNAKNVNALFESKLLLKNQQAGMVKWAETILGKKPEQKRDTLSTIKKLEKVMEPAELDAFLHDLVEKRLGVDVTVKEAGKLTDLARRVEEARTPVVEMGKDPAYLERYRTKTETPKDLETRIKYGTELVLFKDYLASLKPDSKPTTFKEFITTPGKYTENIAAISKSIVASIDNSFWGNQGITALLNPKTTGIWVKNFIKSFGDIKKSLIDGVDATVAARAEAYSRPDAVNGTYAREKLATGLHTEEAFPTSLPERIPAFGRFFRASTDAYTAAALRLRVDIADKVNNAARKSGVDLTAKEPAEAIGHLINSGTGRGSLGAGDAILNKLNVYMFSPRLLKGTFDVLTAHIFDPKVRATPRQLIKNAPEAFAQRQAIQRLVSMAATFYGIMSMYEALNPGSTDLDPRGAHFGQIKVPGTNKWITILGPYRSLIRTMATILPTPHEGKWGYWRRSSSGKWLGHEVQPDEVPPYGAFTALDTAESFLENKASPYMAAVLDFWRGKTFEGEPPTLKGEAADLITPISVQNYLDGKDEPDVDQFIIDQIINFHGFNVTDYDN